MSGARITGTRDGLVAAVAAVAGAMTASVVKSSMMLVSNLGMGRAICTWCRRC